MPRRVIELMDDMHLSSQATFMDFYYAMQANNVSQAANILINNPSLANQIMNADNINILLNETYRRELQPKIDIDYFLEALLNVFQRMIDWTMVMGQWDSNTQYNVHNFVYYNNKAYYAYTNTTPPIGTLPTDTNYWLEYDIMGFQGYGGIDLNLKFNWDNTQSYQIGDVVVYKNKLWYAIAPNTNYEPNLNHYPWVVISMPRMPNKTPIQRAIPTGYDEGDFWFQITDGDEVIVTTWGIRQSEPTPRFASAAFSIGDNIYVVGGIQSNFNLTNVTEAFDTTTGTWSTKANAPTTRARACAFSLGDNGYCVGGIGVNGNILATNEVYDSTTNTWSTGTAYPIPIISSSVSTDTLGYIVGGETTNNVITDSGYSFSASSNTWTAISNKPTMTYGHTLATDGTSLYAVGGIDSNGDTVGNTEAYDIASNSWSQKDTLAVPRSFLASFTQGTNIYAVGGLNSDWYSLDTNEKYEINNNQWVTDMPMNYPRSSLNALVSGTRGFAIGGINFANSDVRGYNEQYNITDIDASFEMIIDTTLDSSGSRQISIPMVSNGSYNYYVDWGDGTTSTQITTYNDPVATHTYASDGEYTVKLIGSLNRLQFNQGVNIATDLKEVTKCTLNFSALSSMFQDCINLTAIPEDIFSYSIDVIDMISIFRNCSSLQIIPVGLFDNNVNATSFSSVFLNSGITSIPTGLFNSNELVSDFSFAFSNTQITTIPAGLFNNCTNVNNMSSCFSNNSHLTTIPNNLFTANSQISNYSFTFSNCTALTNIPNNLFGNSGLASASNLTSMFNGCSGLTSIPTGMFANAEVATSYDNVFRNVNITIIPENCFNGQGASSTNAFDWNEIQSIGDNALHGLSIGVGYLQDLTALTTIGNDIFDSNANEITDMFNGDSALVSIGNIDFSNFGETYDTFTGCTALTTLSGFKDRINHSNPTIHENFDISDCANLTHESLINLSDSLVTMTPSTIKTLTLNDSALARLTDVEKLTIINKYWSLPNYTINITEQIAEDLVLALKGWSGLEAIVVENTSLYYYVRLTDPETTQNYGWYAVDKTAGYVYDNNQVPQYEYYIETSDSAGEEIGNVQQIWLPKGSGNDTNGAILKAKLNELNATGDLVTLTIGKTGSEAPETSIDNVLNLSELCSGFTSMVSFTLNGLGECKPTVMSSMFYNCTNLVSINNIEDINTENVTNMVGLFYNCNKISSIDLSAWDVSNVTTINNLFVGCSNLSSLNLNNWDTSNMTDISNVFNNCSKLPQSFFSTLSNWNTSKVTSMYRTFRNCSLLTTMPSFNMSNVTNTTEMFSNSGLTNILPNILGNKIETAANMFSSCTSLDITGISDWTTIFGTNNNLTNVSGLFSYCSNLKNVGIHNVFSLVEDPFLPYYDVDETKLNNQLFKNCPNITNMSNIFRGCTNLGTNSSNEGLPMGVFYHCPNVTDISYAFANCKNLTIDSNVGVTMNGVLFANNAELVNVSHCFSNAAGSFIGENTYGFLLFPVQTKIEDASYLWSDYTPSDVQGYESIPFIYTSKVLKNIEGMFRGNTFAKNLGNMIGQGEAQYDWANMNTIVPALENCSQLFYGNTGMTDTSGNATTLINAFNKITTLTNHSQAFYNCTALSDYNSIPSDWK